MRVDRTTAKNFWRTVGAVAISCSLAFDAHALCLSPPEFEGICSPSGRYCAFLQNLEKQPLLCGGGVELRLVDLETFESRWWVVLTYRPQDVLVADNGAHVVTFDEWCASGRSKHVIVHYAQGGSARSYSLRDFVRPEDHFGFLETLHWNTWAWGAYRGLDLSADLLLFDVARWYVELPKASLAELEAGPNCTRCRLDLVNGAIGCDPVKAPWELPSQTTATN